MKFEVKNLGPIKQAELELGALTVICGNNNNGKTYLTYTLESFLSTIESNLEIPMFSKDLEGLLSQGSVTVDLMAYIDAYLQEIESTVPFFVKTLPRFLAMHPDRFEGFDFKVGIHRDEVVKKLEREASSSRFVSGISDLKLSEKTLIRCTKDSNSTVAKIEIVNNADVLPPREVISRAAACALSKLMNSGIDVKLFPETFIITCERTGVALFRSELAAAIAKTYDKFGHRKHYLYQRPVERDVDFVLNLKTIVQEQGLLAKENPQILERFREMVGGGYDVDLDSSEVRFTPNGSTEQLSMAESSSTIRSLSELYFYLAHVAQPGQLLIFDEPELNLHPENQRRLARLLVMLVKSGVKLLINTHSDYIVREINILLSIVAIHPGHSEQLLKDFGYDKNLSLDKKEVRAYVLRDGELESVSADDNGVFAFRSFDDTLSEYARLYVAIAEKRRLAATQGGACDEIR